MPKAPVAQGAAPDGPRAPRGAPVATVVDGEIGRGNGPTPGILTLFVARSGRVVPFRLGRQERLIPDAEGIGLKPVHAIDGATN